MDSKVKLSYSKFPEKIDSGIIKISDDQSISLSVSEDEPDSIIIEIKDNSFGAEYLNSFILKYDIAKNFYNILYQLLKQIKDKI